MNRCIVCFALFVAASACFSCNRADETTVQGSTEQVQTELGSMSFELAGTSGSGTRYRLRQAMLVVQGPADTLFFDTEQNPEAQDITATVRVGDYSVFLQEGWWLESLASNDGKARVIDAQLISENPLPFTVGSGKTSVVPLRFRVGGEVVDMGSFAIVLDVEDDTVALPAPCRSDAECSSGQRCCLAGFLGTCSTLSAEEPCPLPDLVVDATVAARTLNVRVQEFAADSCAIAEGCVDAPGARRLLGFATQTSNVGSADIILGDPEVTEGFEFSSCHGHYHFEGYAEYELVRDGGEVVSAGHKQAFCLLDSTRVLPDAPASPRYHCGFQGLQRGWADVYPESLDCQWLDITDLAGGDYTLRIVLNPRRNIPESNYDNNTVEIPVTLTPPGSDSPLDPCAIQVLGLSRECGWRLSPADTAVACTPGATVVAGCGCSAGGECQGDTILRACAGGAVCSSADALASNDDVCGFCSQLSFRCPAQGAITVMTASYASDIDSVCQVAYQEIVDPSLPEPVADAGAPEIGG